MSHEPVASHVSMRPKLIVLEGGRGSIGKELTADEQKIAERAVDGEFHKTTDKTIVCKCIDGRKCQNGLDGPNSAGGTLSLLVADDLSGSERYITSDMSFSDGIDNLTTDLINQGHPVGMHSDDHAVSEASGCGANDKLLQVYELIHTAPDEVIAVAEVILGRAVSSDIHDRVVSCAAKRASFGSGKQTFDTFKKASDSETEQLVGAHEEIVAIINRKHGTTFNREAFDRATGGTCQAFNIDVWAFEESARVVSKSDEDAAKIEAKIVALAYYNAATALTLCGPKMRVGSREDDDQVAA